jgi:hypothetical protein
MGYKTPESIKQAPYSDWWFTPAWNQMHNSNAGNNMGVVVGGNGTGKSWMLGWVSETLGVRPNGEKDLFDTTNLKNHVFFDAESFIRRANELMKKKKRHTIGTQLILDEGQLSLYSKEAFNKEVKNLSRMLMTVRSRRWGVYINLPSFGMLNKDVRMITNWMVQMKGKPTEYSYGTFYNVETNMVSGEPYLKKPVFSKRIITENGMPMVMNTAYAIVPFPKPSRNFIVPYEKMKAEHQKELYEKYGFSEILNNPEKIEEENQKSVTEFVLNGLSNLKQITNSKGKIVATKVAAFLGVSPNTKLHLEVVNSLKNRIEKGNIN